MKKQNPVIQELINKTLSELAELEKPRSPKQSSRNWQDPEGYQRLGVWQNAALLRFLVRKFTGTLPTYQTIKGNSRVENKGNSRVYKGLNYSPDSPLNPTLNSPPNPTLNHPLTPTLKSEHRLAAQLDDAARSVKRNIEEGFKRPTTKEYLIFLGYSQASLEEVKGDIRDCLTDGYLLSRPLSTLKNTLGIDLRVFKGETKGVAKGEPTDPDHPYYQPLSTLNSLPLITLKQTLSYEIFMELVNKTDFLLRNLVVSLENKLRQEKKSYQIDQSRLWQKT